jgi:hypothetical protein
MCGSSTLPDAEARVSPCQREDKADETADMWEVFWWIVVQRGEFNLKKRI